MATAPKAAPRKPVDMGGSLKSLAASMKEAQPGEKIIEVPVSRIVPDPNQPRRRISERYIESLGASIQSNGQEQAIVVRPITDKKADYMIVFGERRWRACQAVGIKKVKAVVRQLTDEDADEIYSSQVAENMGQQAMDLPDQVAAAVRMVATWGTADAAARMALPKSEVSKLTTIGKAGESVAHVLESRWSEDIEMLYMMARLQKKSPDAAARLAGHWANEDKREGARAQVKAALAKLETLSESFSEGPSHTPAEKAALLAGGIPSADKVFKGSGVDPADDDHPDSPATVDGSVEGQTDGAASAPAGKSKSDDRAPVVPAGSAPSGKTSAHKNSRDAGENGEASPSGSQANPKGAAADDTDPPGPWIAVTSAQVFARYAIIETDRGPMVFDASLMAKLGLI